MKLQGSWVQHHFPAVPQPHPASHGHRGFSEPGAGPPPNPTATLPEYSPRQKEAMLASPLRNPGLGLAWLLTEGKARTESRAWLGSYPSIAAQGQGTLGGSQGTRPISYVTGFEGGRGTGGQVRSAGSGCSRSIPQGADRPCPILSITRAAPARAVTRERPRALQLVADPSAGPGVAPALPSHVLGWRGPAPDTDPASPAPTSPSHGQGRRRGSPHHPLSH